MLTSPPISVLTPPILPSDDVSFDDFLDTATTSQPLSPAFCMSQTEDLHLTPRQRHLSAGSRHAELQNRSKGEKEGAEYIQHVSTQLGIQEPLGDESDEEDAEHLDLPVQPQPPLLSDEPVPVPTLLDPSAEELRWEDPFYISPNLSRQSVAPILGLSWVFSTLPTVLNHMGVKPDFEILPVCSSCIIPFPASTSSCTECHAPLFWFVQILNRQNTSGAKFTNPFLQFPMKSIELQLRDVLMVPGMEDLLEEW
ncbi:hypothetical protein VKT23_019968 [Stygiomarasmius scandens]|uniref:Uncharacterized protein n=1 Tax=Marasmiellus scandens TaxID=2682957 RepID=A0ABR1IK16_9AGAR